MVIQVSPNFLYTCVVEFHEEVLLVQIKKAANYYHLILHATKNGRIIDKKYDVH